MTASVSRAAALARALALASAMACTASGALAQSAPSRPLRLLVGLPAGGPTDLAARVVATRLGEALGRPIVVDNRPGASGAIAGDLVARATPDGNTLGFVNASNHAVAPVLAAKPLFDPLRDFTPVALVGTTPYVLVASPALPAKSVKELVDHLRANPGRLHYASVGAGTLGHLITEAMLAQTGTAMTHVPYKGSAQVYPELMADRISVFFDNPGAAVPLIKAGKIRALAVSRAVALLPGVPTLIESGLAGFEPVFWYGVVGPAGLPGARVEALHRALGRALGSEAARAELAALGVEASVSTPQAFATLAKSEIERWRALGRKLGLKLD